MGTLSVANPTAGTLDIVGAVVIGTVVDGEFEQYAGGLGPFTNAITGTLSVDGASVDPSTYYIAEITVTGAVVADAAFVSMTGNPGLGFVYCGCFAGVDKVSAIFYNTDLISAHTLGAILKAVVLKT